MWHALDLALPEALSPGLLVALEAVWVVVAGCWMVLQRRSPTATLAWILALAALPVVGVAIYLAVGPNRFARKKSRLSLLRRSRGTYLDAWERATARELSDLGQLARLAIRLEAPPPETARSLTLYAGGDAYYAAVEAEVRAARHHVHVEMYIFERDGCGARMVEALAAAARGGAEVRLLVDDAGSPRLPERFLRPLLEAGGRVERFNPVLMARLRGNSAIFRTHRKIVICDGRVGFTGGINVSDQQSAAARGDAAWRDTAIRLEGAAVHGLQLAFLENWAFATGGASPVPRATLRHYFPEEPPGDFEVQIVPSGPDQDLSAVAHLHVAAIGAARQRVWISTPYFVPDEALAASLASAALRGVDVRLILPFATDSRVVDAASRTYHDPLVRAGARIWLYGPPMLHAKTCVVDEDVAIVGTANLDNRSLRLNFEITAVLYGPRPAAALAELFERDLAIARPKLEREADAPFLSRLAASAARLLSPQL
jgi:cardiolipin synthase